ncbi:ABC transporter substrate-binding protein [Paramaledivibacter caminithermalis]|uniref:Iron complex transport system substrate-binding protein n=1 Tax=Paramaledivibacter caminithermalis (strain DSM 15212 / CIP 107654 / DViRD3) TaxID=1121301 RepID=A0A1M6P346_PARC5|nr:ABC transporter substrate-binding protein [Paramaledivibacter caminithermalis]SHK02338.1 iron complex transport system substrate-binding protein [Paramaledivibacter caminithermalis DSM 15212]
MTKKITAILLCLVLVLSLVVGCKNHTNTTNNQQQQSSQQDVQQSSKQPKKEDIGESKYPFTKFAISTLNSFESKDGSDNKDHYPVTIKNYNAQGEEYKITFTKKPSKVITTNQPPTEILLTLGLQDCMAGTAFLDSPILPELEETYKKIPVLSERYPSKEVVIAQQPDMIFGWSSVFFDKNLGSVESWNEKNVKTFIQRNSGVAPKRCIENVYKDIEDIGKIFNVEDKANKLIEIMKERISDIEEKVKGKEPVKVLVLEGVGDNKYYSYGKKSLVNNMVEKAGGINLADKGGTYSAENIVAKNPDVIILIHYLEQEKDNKEAEALRNNPALKNVNAIRNERIIFTPLSETYAGGIRTINGIERFAKGFYPELFN